MINYRILKMTTIATTICKSNIVDVLNNMMNRNKQQLNMYSQNMTNRQIVACRTYRFVYRLSRSGDVVGDNVGEDQSKQMVMKTGGRQHRPTWKKDDP
jgi:hypothetical protein